MRQVFVSTRLTLIFAVAACAGNERPGPGESAVRDSAGLQIVENAGVGWGDGGWRIREPASIDLGGSSPETEFSRVVGAVRLSDGRLVVANVGTSELRFFGPDAEFLSAAGRQGSGPGEFQAIGGLWLGRGDSLLVADIRAQRLTVFDRDGGVGRSFGLGGRTGLQVGERGMSLAMPQGWLADGGVVGLDLPIRFGQAIEGPYRDTVTVIHFHAGGLAQDTIGRFPGIEMELSALSFGGQTVPTPSPVPLGRQTVIGVSGDRVFVATNDAWEIQERTAAGRLVRLIRMTTKPAAVTEADIAAHREEQIELMNGLPELRAVPPAIKEQILARVRTVSYPSKYTFLAGLLPAADGSLWAQEVGRPEEERQRFAVFDSTGAFLGRIQMPERFRPTAIGVSEVTGVWRDADDVEHVRVYAIDRPARG